MRKLTLNYHALITFICSHYNSMLKLMFLVQDTMIQTFNFMKNSHAKTGIKVNVSYQAKIKLYKKE